MTADWIALRLGDVCTKIGSGATPSGGSRAYLSTGPYALIRSQNVRDEGFQQEGLAFINESQASALSNVEVLRTDVLLNITGDSVARVCQVDPAILPARVNQHVAIVRPKPEELDAGFLRYALAAPVMKARLLSFAGSGGTRNALTKQMIEDIRLLAPRMVEEQRSIARFLAALDEKIGSNNEMASLIDELADAELQRQISSESPDESLRSLNELMDLRREVIDPSDSPDQFFDHYSLPAFDEKRVPVRQRGREIRSVKFQVPKASVLVSKLNPEIPRVWLPLPSQDAAPRISSTEFMVLTPKPPLTSASLYALWRSPPVRRELTARVTGTTGSHQRVRPEDVLSARVPMPSHDALARFSATVEPFYARYLAALEESTTLGEMRATLLPEFMSGRVSIEGGRPSGRGVAST